MRRELLQLALLCFLLWEVRANHTDFSLVSGYHRNTLVTTAHVGRPILSCRMAIAFDSHRIRTIKRLDLHSDTYGGSDVLSLGHHENLVIPIEVVSSLPIRPSSVVMGNLGLNRQSPLLVRWSNVSLAVGAITFGGLNELFRVDPFRPLYGTAQKCLGAGVPYLCHIQAYVNNTMYTVRLFNSAHLVLPASLYDALFFNLNTFVNTTSQFPTLALRFDQGQCTSTLQSMSIDRTCSDEFTLSIPPENYMDRDGSLLVDKHHMDNSTIVMGQIVFRSAVFHYDAISHAVAIRSHNVATSLTLLDTIFIIYLTLVYIHGITTWISQSSWVIQKTQGGTIQQSPDEPPAVTQTSKTVSLVLACVNSLVVILCIFTQDINRLLSDYIFPVFALLFLTCVMTVLYLIGTVFRFVRPYSIFPSFDRSFAFHYTGLTAFLLGIWFCFYRRRTDTLANTPHAILTAILIFHLAVFVFLLIHHARWPHAEANTVEWWFVLAGFAISAIMLALVTLAWTLFPYLVIHYAYHPFLVYLAVTFFIILVLIAADQTAYHVFHLFVELRE